jgi:hypothetical protein
VLASGVLTNPIDGTKTDLGANLIYSLNTSLHQSLELQRDRSCRHSHHEMVV